MTKLSLTILIAALLVSSPALSSGRNAHASTAIAIDSGRFVVTQSRSHPQSRLAREAYITRSVRADCKNGFQGGACEARSGDDESVPINRPGRDSPQFIERGHDKGVRGGHDDGWAKAMQISCVFVDWRVGYVCD